MPISKFPQNIIGWQKSLQFNRYENTTQVSPDCFIVRTKKSSIDMVHKRESVSMEPTVTALGLTWH